MDNTAIDPIRKVQSFDTAASPKAVTPAPADLAAARRTASTSDSDTAVKPVEAAPKGTGSQASVSLHFRVDEKTNELTVFVVDRKSKRVLRSIPASELHKLQVGDLLKLTA